MMGYLTEQQGGLVEEDKMRREVIETMGALQSTVETLSTVSLFTINIFLIASCSVLNAHCSVLRSHGSRITVLLT